MKLLAAIILGGAMSATSWADTVKITLVREAADGSPASSAGTVDAAGTAYVVQAGQSRVFDGMRTLQFSPTAGDCSGVDASKLKLKRQASDGEVLRVSTSQPIDGQVVIQLEYESRKFLGTTERAYNAHCRVKNSSSSSLVSFSQTSLLRKGEPPLLLRSISELKVFGVIEP